jgi:four helix bundle protein
MGMRTFDDLHVWKRSHAVTLRVYRLTRSFPNDEKFGLVSQIRRAAVSVEANLAEGCKRGTKLDFAHFVTMARASAAEVECLVQVSVDLGFIERPEGRSLRSELDQLQRMLTTLRLRLTAA